MHSIVDHLKKALASNFCLYLKTQKFHWNVQGPCFAQLHEMFSEQYQELFEASDTIAEHIRALNILAPGSLKEFSELSIVMDGQYHGSAQDMLQELLNDHEAMVSLWSEVTRLCATQGDEASLDLGVERMRSHQKTAWMLRSSL